MGLQLESGCTLLVPVQVRGERVLARRCRAGAAVGGVSFSV